LLNFTLYPGNEYHYVFRLHEIETRELLTDSQEIVMSELLKFRGEAVENLSTPMEKWLHFLEYSRNYMVRGEELLMQLREEEGIQQAVGVFRGASHAIQHRHCNDRNKPGFYAGECSTYEVEDPAVVIEVQDGVVRQKWAQAKMGTLLGRLYSHRVIDNQVHVWYDNIR
jgi:hypothetical protein